MQRIPNLLTQAKRTLTNFCPVPKGKTHKRLGLFYSRRQVLLRATFLEITSSNEIASQFGQRMCNAWNAMHIYLPSRPTNHFTRQSDMQAFCTVLRKKKFCFVHVCVCVLHCFLGWLVRGCCFFFFVVRGMWRIYFSQLLILTPLFHCCMFEGDALVIHFLNLLPFAFFLSYRTFPFVNWLLSLFAPLLNCAHPLVVASKGRRCFCRCICRSGRDWVLRSRKTEMHFFSPSLLFHWHEFSWLWMIYII